MMFPVFSPLAEASLPFPSGLQLWLDSTQEVYSDNGSTLATEGASVARWDGQSANSNQLLQTDISRQPIWRDRALNFNPGVDFQNTGAVSDYLETEFPALGQLNANGQNGKTLFVVAARRGLGDSNSAFYLGPEDLAEANTGYVFEIDQDTRVHGRYFGDTDSASYAAFDGQAESDQANIFTFSHDTGQANRDHSYSINGNVIVASQPPLLTNPDLVPDLDLERLLLGSRISPEGFKSNHFDGLIGEVVIYDGDLSLPTRQAVQSYLALKYGVTLSPDDDQPIEDGDYVSTSNQVVWDNSEKSDFHTNVAGIFRDDSIPVQQRISSSQDSHSLVTIATSNDFASPNSDPSRTDLQNNTYLVWGNNDQSATAWTNEATPDGFFRLGNNESDARAWMVQETGSVGEVYVQANTNAISSVQFPELPVGAVLQLLVAENCDFENAENFPMTNTSGTLWSTDIAVNLDNNDCYTFGYEDPNSEPENPETVALNVELLTPNGDQDLGPFEVTVSCQNGDSETFNLNGGETVQFEYPLGIPIDCSVSQNLTPAQAVVFTETFGDDQGADDGQIALFESLQADGLTFTVVNTITNPETVTLNVEVLAPNGDNGVGPFSVAINCQNGDSHLFVLNGGSTASFEYPANTAIDCQVTQTLTETQTGIFITDLGRNILNSNSDNIGGETFTVTNTFIETGTIDLNLSLTTPNGGQDLGPFEATITCVNPDFNQVFSLNDGETVTFQYPADIEISCFVGQNLTPIQTALFTEAFGDDFTIDNGQINVDNSTAADGTTFTIVNTLNNSAAGTIDLNLNLSTPNGDQDLGPFEATITCTNADFNQVFSLNNGETVTFQYPLGIPIDCSVGQNLTPAQAAVFAETFGDDQGPDNGQIALFESSQADGLTFTIVNTADISPDAIDINLRLDLPDGGEVYAPFAVTVSCASGEVFNFNLSGGETVSFTQPEDQPVDCRVTQDLTALQLTKFTEAFSDDFGPNNGAIITDDALSADGSTLVVTNSLLSFVNCDIEIGASIWNGRSNTDPEQTVLLEQAGETIVFDISTVDGQWVNRLNAGQVAFDETVNGTYTIMPDRSLFDLELFFASLSNSAVGNFTLTYENGDVITNAPFEVINDTIVRNNPVGDFTADLNDDTLATVVTIDGAQYLQDPISNGNSSQAAARITFPDVPTTPGINEVTKIEFEVLNNGQSTSSLGVFGLRTGFEILNEEVCEALSEPELPAFDAPAPASSGGAPVRYVVEVCDELTGETSTRFPFRDRSVAQDPAFDEFQSCVANRFNKTGYECAAEWALNKGYQTGACSTVEETNLIPTDVPEEIFEEETIPVEENFQNKLIEEASFDRDEVNWNRIENNLQQIEAYPLTGKVPGWLRDKYDAHSVLPRDSADDRYYEPTVNLLRQGIIDGHSTDGGMHINLPLRRSELAKILAIGTEARKDYTGPNSMGDVSTDTWYYPYAESMVRAGILTTNRLGNFRAEEAVSLGHYMTALGRAFNLESTKANFIARNLIGAEIATLDFEEVLTRGQAFDILTRVLNMVDRNNFAAEDQVVLSIPQKGINNLPASNTVITDPSVWLDDLSNIGAAHTYDPDNDNYVVFAHSSIWEGDPTPYGPVMENLIGGMEVGEIIEMTTNEGTAKYRVVGSQLVDPSQVDTANDSASNVDLIIFTCGTDYLNERWVIKAERI